MNPERIVNHFTIDFELPNLPQEAPLVKRERFEERLESQLDALLKAFDKHNVTTTFFVVGELAARHPVLFEKIKEENHEIASHAITHKELSEVKEEEFRKEAMKIKKLLGRVKGFRAPIFSLSQKNSFIIDVLKKNRFLYDSSIVPSVTTEYGAFGAPFKPYRISSANIFKEHATSKFIEFPILTIGFGPFRIPAGGGFFLRLLPIELTELAIKKMNHGGAPATLYAHNWEFDSKLPGVEMNFYRKTVVYYGTGGLNLKRLERLLKGFKFGRMDESPYLK
ncbi:polysaccharide deacetylase family protein [Candidatus Micrarchaeota archaeon]|nr:polysaccharide deacetylase family protein [Candidatus Micrarchaeota archaeon]